jgi:hypothetical protein
MEEADWKIKNSSRVRVTRPPIGCTWVKPQAEAGWTGKTSGRRCPSRIYRSLPGIEKVSARVNVVLSGASVLFINRINANKYKDITNK